VTITNSTISGNSATGSGGGIWGGFAGSNSIFANENGGNVTNGEVTSLGHNLFTDTPPGTLLPTVLLNTDPLLGPLADNGGPTFTMALLPGSPAIDTGSASAGVTADQRGIPRPQGTAPDIGAFESRGFTLAPVGGNDQAAGLDSPFPSPLVVAVSSAFGEPVAGGRVTFSAPATGPSAVFTGNPATIDSRRPGRRSRYGQRSPRPLRRHRPGGRLPAASC